MHIAVSEAEVMGNQPVNIIEIDQTYCSRSYGFAPCTANEDDNCFNTRSTCDDPENFDASTLTLKFIDNESPPLRDGYYLPFIDSIKVSPASINRSGSNESQSPLGKRGVLTVTFNDYPHNDRLVDPYLSTRNYIATDRGTFWSKWRARNEYYLKRPIRLISGYLKDGQIVNTITREFFISSFSGPSSSGKVTIQAKDVLWLLEDKKAQMPLQNSGTLAADITDSSLSFSLSPSGIGDAEYSASGKAIVNDEIMSFTRTGDAITISSLANRGVEGTDATAHSLGDNFQECLEFSSEEPQDILYTALNTYAGIDASYLDKTQWDAEQVSHLPSLYSAVIAHPTSVNKLVAEMIEQMQFTLWYDERDSKVYIRANRNVQDEIVTDLNDAKNLIESSVSWNDKPKQLITRVWVYYGQLNKAKDLDEPSNYSAASLAINSSAEGSDQYDTKQIRKVFSRWIPATGGGTADLLADSYLTYYSAIPKGCSFSLSSKDRDLWLADYIRIQNYNRVDEFGNPLTVSMQVDSVQESKLGNLYSYQATEYTEYDSGLDPDARPIIISSNLVNVNLYDLFVAEYGVPSGTENVTVTIKSGVIVGGDVLGSGANGVPGLRSDSFDFYDPAASSINGLNMGSVPYLQRQGIAVLRTTAQGQVYSGVGVAAFEIREVEAGVALQTGSSWPVGCTLSLVVEAGAFIVGEGGNGSAHTSTNQVLTTKEAGENNNDLTKSYATIPGGDGGHALKIDRAISITNNGVIAGGGGGGAAAWYLRERDSTGTDVYEACIPGGGGAGYMGGFVRSSLGKQGASPTISETDASASSTEFGGEGATYRPGDDNLTRVNYETGFTGDGGDLGQSGEGSSLRVSGVTPFTGLGDGGQPGDAVEDGSELITWVTKGTVMGAEN